MMRQFNIISAMLFFLFGFSIYAKAQKHGYNLSGQLEGLKEGEKVTMAVIHNDFGAGGTPMDSAYVRDGEFKITGYVPEGPQYYGLFFDKHPTKVIRLFIDNLDDIIIRSTDIEKIPHDILDNYVVIYGSISNKLFHDFISASDYHHQLIGMMNADHYLKDIKDSIGFDPMLVGGILQAKRMAEESLFYMFLDARAVQGNTRYDTASRAVIPFLIYITGIYEGENHPAILNEIYNRLDEKSKNSYYGKQLKQKVIFCSGQSFPAFSLPDPEGKAIASNDVLAKSKIMLVHFWSSNSVVRKQYQDELKAMYAKYHNKGFNIIGVSSDDSSTAYNYKKILREQPFPWINVCDFKGKEGIVEKRYHEYGNERMHNTTNVLIGPDGKIISWDPTGLELQWYLWKYLGE